MIIDLFCGGGVIAEAFDDSVGVDLDRKALEYYPHQKVLGSGTRSPFRRGAVELAHASPPCPAFSTASHGHQSDHPDLIDPARLELMRISHDYIMENVPPAPIRKDLVLCHAMFGLPGARHRKFEISFHVDQPAHAEHDHILRHHSKNGLVPDTAYRKGSRKRNVKFLGCRDLPADISGRGVPPAFMSYILDQYRNPRQRSLEEFF